MPFEFTNWRKMEGDGLVVRGPVLLYSVAAVGRDTGDWGDVYEGLDAVSGNHAFGLVGREDTTYQLSWDPPLFFDRGIYLDAETDLTGALFSYRTIDSSPFKLEQGG